MSIAFLSIPDGIRTPGFYVEFDASRAVQGLTGLEHRVLILGQKLAGGEAPAGVLTQTPTGDDAKIKFGEGSHLHHMVLRARAASSTAKLWCMPLDDSGGGNEAEGALAWSGTAVAAGTIHLYVGGRKVQIGVAQGDEADAIAAAVADAIDLEELLGVGAGVDAEDATRVLTTHRHKGEIGNDIDLRVNANLGEELPAGVSVTITQPTGGTGNPTILSALAALGDEWFTEVVMPYKDGTNVQALEEELADRAGAIRQIDGSAFLCLDDTLGNLGTYGEDRNSPWLTVLGIKGSPTPAYEIAAVVAAIVSQQTQTHPARPLTGLPLRGVLAPVSANRFTQLERDTLLHQGVSTLTVGSGGAVQIDRLITTYQRNTAGTIDESYLDLNTVTNLRYLRFSMRVRLSSRFERALLAQDGTRFSAGQPVITPLGAKAELVALFDEWEADGLVEDAEQFLEDLVVEIDTDPVRINILLAPNLVNPLLITAVQIGFRR